MDTPEKYLRIPLYGMYYIDNIEEFSGFDEVRWEKFRASYSDEEFLGIVDSIQWAVRHRDYDFASLLPGIPHENNQIYEFFAKLDASLKNSQKPMV